MATDTLNKIKSIIRNNQEDQTFPKLVSDTLAPFEGKQVTRRLATALEKATGMTVHYEKPDDLFNGQVSMWGNDVKYDQRHTFTLPKGTFTLENFKAENGRWYSASVERNEKRDALLKQDDYLQRLADAVDAYNKARADIEGLLTSSLDNPDVYDIEALMPRFKVRY